MKEIIEAHKLLSDIDNKDFLEVVKEFESYSNQLIPKKAVDAFIWTGLLNTDFLFSDFLNKYGLKNLTQLKDI